MIATKIKRIVLTDPSLFTKDIETLEDAKALIKAMEDALTAGTAESVTNVHETTWEIQESDASVNSYHNELDSSVYHRDLTPGELSIAFTMGEYSEKLKAALKGGKVITKGGTDANKDDVIGYKGDAQATEIRKTMFCLSRDGYWFIYPKALIAASTKTTDNIAALAVTGYPEKNGAFFTEYNINSNLLA